MDRGEDDIRENIRVESGTEDELSVPTKLSRVTPRNSLAGKPSPTSLNPTPHANLRQLAAIIRMPSTTPRRRRSSFGAPLSQRQVAPNTLNRSHTPSTRPPLQPSFGNRSNPTTPHAIRALRQRRATPGRDRRKSGRLQRETPRDVLRNLSKVLAPTSQLIKPSPLPPTNEPKQTQNDGFKDDQDLPRPRFSIAIDDVTGDDDSFQERPPRLSMPLDDGQQTGRSIEIARRTVNEPPPGRLSRGSFGSNRASDRFGNISELGYDDASNLGIDDSIVPPALDDDADELGDFGEYSDLGTDASEQPFEDANLEEPEQLFEDDDLDQPDILLTDSRIYQPVKVTKARNRVPKTLKRSRHGIPYPSLPPGVTKKIATTCIRALGSKKSSISKETLTAIMEASEQYFKQVSEDLGAFAQHAGRKKIDESDVIAIMKRYVKSSYIFDNG
ncbi:hypothetical protein OEA41_006101 [Lepraria neglecta]|uniref:CENP-T/Histone H4 histone fold domain-containing protein n=1 Tax=Lepraria neglecta TaxID=209136 RepID=A0AAD9Z889_9LECA|nr:hypothetical protein OEA41_006101 [Lepraria neglecta]